MVNLIYGNIQAPTKLSDTNTRKRTTKMKTLICTVGLPRSGKSTWAQGQNVPVVNPDSIRLALYGRQYWAPAEKMVWALADVMVKALFMAGHDKVILDATNTTRAQRDQWRSTEWQTCFHRVLPFMSVELCKTRAISSNQPDLIPVIEKMAAEFESLGDDELRYDLP